MMTKDQAVTQIVEDVGILTDKTDDDSIAKIKVFAGYYYDSACAMTGYEANEFPDSLLSFVLNATLQAWRKRGAEGLTSQNAAGISEQYLDVDYALRQNLRHKRNPMSAVVIAESDDDA